MNLIRQVPGVRSAFLRLRGVVVAIITGSSLLLSFIVAPLVRTLLLRGLYTDFRGATVCLIGGAPSAVAPEGRSFEKYVAISSGGDTLKRFFSHRCDLSVMDESFFNIEHSRACASKAAMHQIEAYATEATSLVVVSSNNIEANMEVEAFIDSERNYYVSKWMRGFIVNYVCGTNYLDGFSGYQYTQVGSGAWTLALLVFLKIDTCHITGLNLRTGTDGEFTRYRHGVDIGVKELEHYQSRCRNHSSPDLNVISAIALRYRGKIKLTTNEIDLECAISPNLS